jgi:flagellar biosynthesis regulator FlbT
MQRIIPLFALIGLLILAGCRLSREPESLAPAPPLPAAGPAPIGPPPEEISPEPPKKPAALDYLDSLSDSLSQAQEEVKQEALERLLGPQGSLAAANRSLSLLESRLPQAAALYELQRIRGLVSKQQTSEAAQAMEELIIQLEPVIRKGKFTEGITIESLQNALKAILEKKTEEAARHLDGMIEILAASPVLKEIQEIRADLEQGLTAAALKRVPVAKVVLECASERMAHLKEMLAEPEAETPPVKEQGS